MSVINTNITSMIGQQNLNESKNALTTSMERLSSGLRINSAKDDAAGQAIANRMSAQITGLSTAQRNANDGISVAQTAEGALNQVNDNLQRVRELAVQAENGTNSEKDLTSIQDEINQRLGEIDRISSQTDFNGVKVLQQDGGLNIQVGANDGETISVNLQEINAETLGLSTFNVDGQADIPNEAATKDDLDKLVADSGNWALAGSTYTHTQENTAVDAEAAIDRLSNGDTVAVTDDGGDTVTYTFNAEEGNFSYSEDTEAATGDAAGLTGLVSDINTQIGASPQSDITFKGTGGTQTGIEIDASGNLFADNGDALYIEGGELTSAPVGGSPTQADRDGLVDLLATTAGAELTANDVTYTTTTAHDSGGGTAGVVSVTGLTESTDNLVDAIENNGASGTTSVTYGAASGSAITGSVTLQNDGESTNEYVNPDGNITTDATSDVTYEVQDGDVIQTNGMDAGSVAYMAPDGSVTTDETTAGDRTENPLAALDSALNQVDSLRSELGAVQNRFESAITNLSTNETNLSAARSRIEDADYATEVANMTKNQILQQAGTSVLAQANQLPQSVLSLLG
ncbi:flagellin [Halomonas saccharevitans]|uniref:Flagellin n=1 Tax=Halomonas saccharevitans TaxID=416872 RepID=A0ABU3NDG9_9GAMM|nr:flagellin [Halomonas saccharevitans]MDT8879224.1 flagellin [Halomonas saccharevitans]